MPISADRVDPVLAVRGLVVNHGSLEAVHGIDLDVGRGEIAFLVGPNGAGKSSTLLAICGSIRPRDGSIHFNGHSIAGAKPETIVRHGIALVPEGRRIFGTLTVAENLAVPLKLRRDREQAEKDLQRILEIFPVLRRRYLGTAGQLSGGEQQQLAIGRSLLCAPSLLLVDEPSLGLAPRITEEV
ncbi:MAG: ABC transporter ATP-binding protein, partial [Rhizobiaceae bacterium]